MRYLISVYLAVVVGALAGALIGLPIQQISGQEGWMLVVGSTGANAAALWAGMRRASGLPFWRIRPQRRQSPAPNSNPYLNP